LFNEENFQIMSQLLISFEESIDVIVFCVVALCNMSAMARGICLVTSCLISDAEWNADVCQ